MPQSQRRLLIYAITLGFLALVAGYLGLFIARDYALGFDFSQKGLDNFSGLLFDSARLLVLEQPDTSPTNLLFIVARILAVLFVAAGTVGVILELSRSASDWFLRRRFWLLERSGKQPAVIIGLGWIGGPLAKELRADNRPVYAITMDENSVHSNEARRQGALIIEGDATKQTVRKRAKCDKSSEIFIATGDDVRNIEIAGSLLKDAEKLISEEESISEGNLKKSLDRFVYIHAGDPGLTKTIRSQKLFDTQNSNIKITLFSNSSLAALDFFSKLFLDQNMGVLTELKKAEIKNSKNVWRLPSTDEVFHLFIFGFDKIGQAVALQTARFSHFMSGFRPRVTIFGDTSKGKNPWNTFLKKYPAYAPSDLDLACEEFLSQGDVWDARPGYPKDFEFQTYDNNNAIEYAVNAEYIPALNGAMSSDLLQPIRRRLVLGKPKVRAAVVFCFEDHHKNSQGALNMRQELACRLFQEENADILPCLDIGTSVFPLPIFAYLPKENGLMKIDKIKESEGYLSRYFPFYSFGQQQQLTSYKSIKGGYIEEYANNIRQIYKILSGKKTLEHPDFESSDTDTAIFSEVKLDALNIAFKRKKNEGLKAIFDEYYTAEVESEYKKLKIDNEGNAIISLHDYIDTVIEKESASKLLRAGHTLAKMANKEYESTKSLQEYVDIITGKDTAKKLLLEKLTLLNLLNIEMADSEKKSAAKSNSGFDRITAQAKKITTLRAINRFENYIKSKGQSDPEIAAKMEHNRWMGERFTKNWRYGPRSDLRKQRIAFVSWDNLSEELQYYDKQQIPLIILDQRERGRHAYLKKDPKE